MPNKVGLEHDGTNCTIKSDDQPVLQTPFLEQSTVPTFLMGRDGSSPLPFYFDINAAIPILPAVGPTPTPTTPTTCVQVRCGVADAMVSHLNSLYETWSNWLGAIISALAPLGVAAVLAAMATPPAWILDAIGGVAVLSALKVFITNFTGNVGSIVLPYYSVDIVNELRRELFCQLTCANNVCVPTAAQMFAWSSAVAATPPPGITTLEEIITRSLIENTSMSDWQQIASSSSASTLCDTYVCP